MANKIDLVFRGTLALKLAVEEMLRNIFASPDIIKDPRYRYIPTMEAGKSSLSIYRAYPQRVELYPSLFISSGAYTGELMSMSDEKEMGSERREEDGTLVDTSYVGHSIVPITITVVAKQSSDDRDNLTDILMMIFRVLGRAQFARYGFTYNKIEVAGDSEDEGDDGVIYYRNSVTLNCNTDYWYVFDASQEDLINTIGLKVFGQKTPSDTRIQLHPD